VLGLVRILAVFVDNAVPVKEKRFFLLAHTIFFPEKAAIPLKPARIKIP
jgi:hypothetical protein